VLAPYRDTGRFVTFVSGNEVIPGVKTVDLNGHTPGHTGYLFGRGDQTVLFWGDTIHSDAVQLRRTSITIAYDSADVAAVASRRKVFDPLPRTDGGSAPPTCPSRVWDIFAAIPTATPGCRSRSHPPTETRSSGNTPNPCF
jgi:hypothetical protein